MSLHRNYFKNIPMDANAKCEFAELKYEQLLNEKYFIKTCFSKKDESFTAKQKLADLLIKIKYK